MDETPAHHAVLARIRAEYVEMPGMSLRLEQVARLCGVDMDTCKLVLDALVEARFLRLAGDGRYSR
jgi:DNA-binding IclR family transcriptional regulator